MRGERYIPCPANNEGCKYAPRCFEDSHHVYPERTADTRLKRIFGNLSINKIVSCRRIHEDVLDNIPEPDYPPVREMKDAVYEQRRRPA